MNSLYSFVCFFYPDLNASRKEDSQIFSKYVIYKDFWCYLDFTNYPITYQNDKIICTKELSNELNILKLDFISIDDYIKYVDSIKQDSFKWPKELNFYYPD